MLEVNLSLQPVETLGDVVWRSHYDDVMPPEKVEPVAGEPFRSTVLIMVTPDGDVRVVANDQARVPRRRPVR